MPNIDPALFTFWIAKSTVLFLLGFAATRLLRHGTAATRHAIWAVVFGAQILVPFSSFGPPEVAISLPAPITAIERDSVGSEEGPAPAAEPPAPGIPHSPRPSRRSWQDLGLLLWLAGGALVVMRHVAGTFVTRSSIRTGKVLTDSLWIRDLERLRAELTMRRRVTLVTTDRVTFPQTCGSLFPTIFLPPDAEQWTERVRADVLLHELAHIRRFDTLTASLGHSTVAVFWFHPLAWLARKRFLIEAEGASDDFVLRAGVRPSSYASTLLRLAGGQPDSVLPASAGMSSSDLEERIASLIAPGRAAAARRRGERATAAAACVVAALPVLAVQPSAPPVARTLFEIENVAGQFECDALVIDSSEIREMSGRLTMDAVTRHYFFLRPEPGRCIEASFSLDAEFSENDRDLVLSEGLRALIREKKGSLDRVVTVEVRNGRVERVYRVNGSETPWSRSTDVWYESFLPEVIRRTTAGVESRTARMLRTEGVDALLEEVVAIPMVSVRGRYLEALLAQADGEELPRDVLIAAATSALGDHPPTLAVFLGELVAREGAVPAVRTQVLFAAAELAGSSDRQTVLERMARHRDARVRVQALKSIEMLEASWRPGFLESSAPLFLGGDPLLADAWFDALESVPELSARRDLLKRIRGHDPGPDVAARIDFHISRI